MSSDYAFYSVGCRQGLAVRAVRICCGWSLAVRGPQGKGVTHLPPFSVYYWKTIRSWERGQGYH